MGQRKFFMQGSRSVKRSPDSAFLLTAALKNIPFGYAYLRWEIIFLTDKKVEDLKSFPHLLRKRDLEQRDEALARSERRDGGKDSWCGSVRVPVAWALQQAQRLCP